jgi:hypothetical protein
MTYNKVFITVTFAASLMCSASWAADAVKGDLPAVSGVNGKIELSGGVAGIDRFDNTALVDRFDNTAVFQGGASISVPLGDRFGLQFDAADVNKFSDNMIGGNLHLFTRNPDSYLFGAVGGFAHANNANISYIGPEAELYLNNISIEALGGYMHLDVAGVQSDKLFAIGDIALYATDDLRFAVGASTIADFKSAHVGAEWQLQDMPISLTANARIGDDNFKEATVGLKFYFGGDNKSLIRRHREDDPRNRTLDIFDAAGSAFKPPLNPCLPPKTLVAPGECSIINNNG